jgi:hypothetical protein
MARHFGRRHLPGTLPGFWRNRHLCRATKKITVSRRNAITSAIWPEEMTIDRHDC